MKNNKKTSAPMKLLAWLMMVVMVSTSISVPALAEDFYFDDGSSVEFTEDMTETDTAFDEEGAAAFSDETFADESADTALFFDGEGETEIFSEEGEDTTEGEVTAASDAEIYLTVGMKGVPAQAKDGSAMLDRSVIVKDINSDGKLTYDEALTAAHEAYYEGGAATGYGSETTEFGLSLKKLWGDTSGIFGYWLNDTSCWSLADEVKDGDSLNAFVYKDAVGWSDAYVRFDNSTYITLASVVCDVVLEKAVYDTEAGAYAFQSCGDAAFSVYDSARKLASEENYTVSDEGILFKVPGTYYLVASGTESVNYAPATVKVVVSRNPSAELKGITLNYTSRTVPVDKSRTTQLKATLDPADLTGVAVTWESSNPEVATVDNGTVQAVSPGTTVITAKAGNMKAECTYKVTEPPTLSSVKCYVDSAAYNAGEAPLTMTPDFEENKQDGYTVQAPDYVSSLYVEGTISKSCLEDGYDSVKFLNTWGSYDVRSADENGVKAFTAAISGNKTAVAADLSYIYQLNIARYTTLKNLVADGRMQGTFDKKTNTYKILIDNDSAKFGVTPTAYNAAYKITVNGTEAQNGERCEVPYNWDKDGKMTVLVEVSGENMISSTYTLELEKSGIGTAPVIQEQPKSADYAENEKADALTVEALASGNLTYQWYVNETNSTENGTAIENATEKSYVPSTEKKGTFYYYCVLTNTRTETNNTAVTDVAAVTVYTDPTPNATLTNPGSTMPKDGYEYAWDKGYVYNVGETASPLTVTATTKAEGGVLSYEWKRISKPYAQSVSVYEPGGDADAASYTPEITQANANDTGRYYGCQVTCTYNGKKYTSWAKTGETFTVGEGENAQTYDVIGVYVFIKTDKAAAPGFVNQPKSGTYEVGKTISTMYANATKTGGGTLTYQWYVNDKNSTENGTPIANATSYYYRAGKATEVGTKYYYCVATNTLQGHTASLASNIAEIIVTNGASSGDDTDDEEIGLSGKGTEEEPYLIKTAQDYITVANLVDAGTSFAGKYLRQERNITLPKGWEPIGTTKDRTTDIQSGKNMNPFSGNLDGNGKTLTVPEGGLPLLGYVKEASVSNLKIYGKKIAGYGLVNNYVGVGLSGTAITIDNVTLKSGTSTLKSGLIGTYITTNGYAGCSAGYDVVIRNCTAEKGVVIGYQKDQSMIGSFAGRFQGSIENCVSYADVYGMEYVGGIAGTVDNAMGGYSIIGSTFDGTVTASGEYAGGIIGGGYHNSTAPNGHRISIKDCKVGGNVSGSDRVGGIHGGDGFVAQNWSTTTIKGNSFTGKVTATGSYVGGIIGYYNSLNKNDVIINNYYSAECGVTKGVGFIKYLDTSYSNPTASEGTVYFSTENGTDNCPEVTGAYWHGQLNRTDDPLGVHAKKLANTNPDQEPEVLNLILSGEYETTYYAGEKFDTTGMQITAEWSDDTTTEVNLDEVTIDDSAMSTKGWQTVRISYKGADVSITVRVLTSIKVTFSLYGDSKHNSDEDGKVHTLADDNLENWVPETVYYMSPDATVYDVMLEAAEQYGFTIVGDANNQYNTMYIKGITWKGQTLSELDNGVNSGWMDIVNGVHPDVGVALQTLQDGDVIIFHYTDDYQLEESKMYDQSQAKAVTKLIQNLPTEDKLTLDDKEAVQKARNAYDQLTDAQKALVSEEDVKLLEAAEARMEKLSHVHKWSSWKTVSAATVKAAKVQERTCSTCGEVQKRTVGSKLTPVLELPGKLKSVSMKNGQKVSMTVTMANGDAVSSVKTSNSKRLQVSLDKKTGKITLKALKTGTAKLKIKLSSGKSKTYTVTIGTKTIKTSSLAVTSVKNGKLTLEKGNTHSLKTTLKPFTSTQKRIYESSNPKVATVSSKGKIEAVAAGKATITVTSGNKSVKITVTVPGIKVSKTSVTVKKNKTITLEPKTYGISEKVVYTSSDPKVATVSSKGKVKGIKAGTAKITIKAGSYKKTVTVTVK